MTELLTGSGFFAIGLTVAAFCVGQACQKKWKKAIFNPILIGAALVMLILWLLDVPVAQYQADCAPLTYLLTPATVSLAIPLYRQLDKLKRHFKAILVGICSGVLASGLTILGLCALFGLSHTDYVTLLPKSVTTAIGMSLSTELGGVAAITVTSIVITGLLGNCMAVFLCRLFRITEPVAKGLAIGTASHALGTSKALEIGEVEGAMSGLSIAVAGLMTVAVAQFFAGLV